MDWSFERTMAAIGCTVRAFDPASTQPDTVNHKNIHFYKIGIGHKTGKQKLRDLSGGGNTFELKTLEDIVTENGDLGRAINYLKIDVEGSELLAIPQWLETPEILENIDQIQIEIHTQVQAGVFHIHYEGNLLRGIDNKTVRI